MNELAQRWAEMEPRKRRLVEAALSKRGVDPTRLPIEARPEAEPAPLSLAQERLWILSRLLPGSTVYNETYRAEIEVADLDLEALRRAWRRLAGRQRALRSRFVLGADGEGEVRADGAEPPLEVVDLSAEADPPAAFESALHEQARLPFDLARGPVARGLLARLGPGRWGFVVALHHIVCDGASILILANDLSALYGAEVAGAGSRFGAPPELPVQYGDYAHWQRRVRRAELEGRGLDYWARRLEGAPTVLPLPTPRRRPPVESHEGDALSVRLPADLDERVARFARERGTTPFVVLLAAFGALLGRYTGERDLLVGTPVDTRDRDELRGLIGFFVNTLALRLDLSGSPGAADLVERVRAGVIADFEHRTVPFARVVERLAPERSPGHAPLVQVLFILQPPPAEVEASHGLALGLHPVENGTSKFDLTAILRRVEGGLDLRLQYATDLFDRPAMARFAGHYETLLAAMVADPETSVWDLPLLAPGERRWLADLNATAHDAFPADRTWMDLFEAQARATPEAPAFEADGEVVTYRALAERAGSVGRRLRDLGVGPEVAVGVAFGHGVEMVVALAGIFAAGGAYVPLDPSYPAERLEYMVRAAGVGLILADADSRPRLPAGPARVYGLDAIGGGAREEDLGDEDLATGAPAPPRDPASLAYLIFTSGSTGRPKAVMVSQRSLANLALNFVESFRLGPGERLLMMLSLSFDASVGDLFPALAAGATVVLHPRPASLGGSELGRELEARSITAIELAAVYWQQWADELARRGGRVPRPLRTVVTGGDSAEVEKVRAWLARADRPTRVLNNYGPTEATVCSAYRAVDAGSVERIAGSHLPIGRPLRNVEVHVLDGRGEPLPVQVPGELAIGGRGVARGYFGRPAATAAKFVPDPFSGRPGARLYRTGDLGRRLPDGDLEFVGRIDDQAKVRGFRVEPGEIEAALAEHGAVREAAVKVVGERAEERRLVAYAVAEPGGAPPDAAALRSYLASRLPAHLVPSAVVLLDALPLTASGKVDRKRLPDPQEGASAAATPTAPHGPLEATVAAIWQRVLGREQVGVHDNFFDLGGHSLLLLRVQGELEESLGRPVPTLDLFRFPTVDALARHLAGEPAPAPAGSAPAPAAAPSRRLGDIAIVGMAGRFPGASDVETLWRNVAGGVESITFFGREELLAAGVPERDLDQPSYVPARGVIERPEEFDAAFFGINPREAELIDPQQRLFLECAWEAIESAGERPEDRPNIGVFAGIGRDHYFTNNIATNPGLIEAAGQVPVFLGNNKDYVATRVAYKLDLRGPAMGIQSACSTSLLAVHEACRSLRSGDCDLALAGGVTLGFPQTTGYHWIDGGIFSQDGHTRAFDARAKGVVPGGGVAVVLLERLEDALANGHPVRAVIRGTGVANDGAEKVGFTAPGVRGQVAALSRALAEAGVEAASVGLVETHGTGTLLGDLIEGTALKEVYESSDPQAEPLAIGSLKTNIGHLDTAAGAAGLIKAALALENRRLPASLHFTELNPKLGFGGGRIFVNDRARDWTPRGGGPRRAAVSSFGLGGTNVHAVLEEAPAAEPRPPAPPWQVLPLSARSAAALDRATANLAHHLEAHPEADLGDVAFTLQVGRRRFAHRRVVVARDRDDALRLLARGGERRHGGVARETAPDLVFLFPGGGAQYVDMARGLDAREPVFRRAFDRCAEVFRPLAGGLDLRALLFPASEADRRRAEARIAETSFALPALFATEVALARLLESRGIEPAALIGHSLGEYAAAHLAGVMSLEDACALVALRGRLFETLPEGAMLSVPLPEEELRGRLAPDLDVAAVNLPELAVASGPLAAIADLERRLEAEGLDVRRVPIAVAAHSRSVEPILAEFRELAARLALRPPRIPLMSNLTGGFLSAEEVSDPEYWVRHLRRTVRFADGIGTLLGAEHRLFLEVGPGHTLGTFARRHPRFGAGHEALPCLRRERDDLDDVAVFGEALGRMWLAGVEPDWRSVAGPEARPRRVPLPTYPFERRRFWIEPGAGLGRSGSAATARFEKPDPADWFYLTTWTRALAPAGGEAAPAPAATWIVGEPEALAAGLTGALAARLASAGSLAGSPAGSLAGSWNEAAAAAREAGGRAAVLVLGTGRTALDALLSAARALAAEGPAPRPAATVVLALAGAARVAGDEALDPEAAAALALAHSLAAELGEEDRAVRVLDLDEAARRDAASLAGRLLSEARATASQVSAWRRDRLWRETTEPVRLESSPLAADRDRRPASEGTARPVLALGGPVAAALAEALAAASGAPVAVLGAEVLESPEVLAGVLAGPDAPAAVVLSADGETAPVATLESAALAARVEAWRRALETVDAALPAAAPRILASSLAARLRGARSGAAAWAAAYLGACAAGRWHTLVWDDAPLDPAAAGAPVLHGPRAAEAVGRVLRQPASATEGPLWVSIADLASRREEWRSARRDEGVARPSSSLLARPDLDVPFLAPRTDDEKLLCGIWAELLGVEQVGVDDNFFDLGGDSVIALQVVARANQAGMQLTQRKTYHNQTVADLAVAARLGTTIHARQAPVTATAPLVAIQQWFFDRGLCDPHFWNLSVMLGVAPGITAEAVGRVVRALVVYHDALRTTFYRQDGAWRQRFGEPERAEEAFSAEDLTALPREERVPALEARTAELQRGLDLERGPLARFVHFDLGDLGEPGDLGAAGEGGGRLLMVLHHAVIDAVSLRILLGDLGEGLQAERQGRDFRLPPKTTALHYWAVRLPEFVRAGHVDDQVDFWTGEERREVAPVPVDHPEGENLQGSADSVSIALSAADTRHLLQGLPRALGTEINDVLLAALAEAWGEWAGADRLLVEVEGHGREPLLEDVDLSRTVGWLTSSYPLLLTRPREDGAEASIRAVRRQLESVPMAGMGYGLLRHLGQRPEVAARLASLPRPEVAFLYLGQFDQMIAAQSPIRAAYESVGPSRSPRDPRSHLLDINARVAEGRLQAVFTYSRNLHHRATIERLASSYQGALEGLVRGVPDAAAPGPRRLPIPTEPAKEGIHVAA